MKAFVHPTAIVDDTAILGEDVYIGPNCYVGPGVSIGARTRLEMFSVVGSRPEKHPHMRDGGLLLGVQIGSDCLLREFTTVHAGAISRTTLMDRVTMLRGSHVGHDALIDDGVNLSCNVLVGGHCYIGRHANLGLGAIVHQRRAVGGLSMVGMGSVVTKDLPPFLKYAGNPANVIKSKPVNDVGLERYGLKASEILEIYAVLKPKEMDDINDPLGPENLPRDLTTVFNEWLQQVNDPEKKLRIEV